MKKILVIGIGSRIMMDDAIGIYLVEDLKRQNDNPNISYVVGETDVEYCMDEILDYHQVVVVDAFLSGKQPGELTIIPMEELNNGIEDCLYSLHGEHFLNKLKNKRHSHEVMLIGIEPLDINYGFSLSTTLKQCYPKIFDQTRSFISQYG